MVIAKKVPVTIFTSDYIITGFVVVRIKKWFFNKFRLRRISDILSFATQRMRKVGQKEFIEIVDADIQDIKTKEYIKTQVRRIVINKSDIKFIIPIETEPFDFE